MNVKRHPGHEEVRHIGSRRIVVNREPDRIEVDAAATEVCPFNKAERVTAKQNPRMARDMRTRPQKKANVIPVFGSSLVEIGFPDTAARMFWMR